MCARERLGLQLERETTGEAVLAQTPHSFCLQRQSDIMKITFELAARPNVCPLSLPKQQITAGLDVPCRHTKVNLPKNRESYGRLKTIDGKLSWRRIYCCGDTFYVFIFWQVNFENWQKCPNKLGSPPKWMHLTKSSSTEVSGPSEVLGLLKKYYFIGSHAGVTVLNKRVNWCQSEDYLSANEN